MVSHYPALSRGRRRLARGGWGRGAGSGARAVPKKKEKKNLLCLLHDRLAIRIEECDLATAAGARRDGKCEGGGGVHMQPKEQKRNVVKDGVAGLVRGP